MSKRQAENSSSGIGRDRRHGYEGTNGCICRDGLPGPAGRDGEDGERGMRGETGERGEKGDPGPPGNGTGVVYIRWGKTTCPSGNGTELVYSGRAGGSRWNEIGGAANLLCMPEDPQYSNATYISGIQGAAYVYGTQYEIPSSEGLISNINNRHTVLCAVCYAPQRSSKLMIPAQTDCPEFWTKEYEGALMCENRGYYRGMYECVDKDAESGPLVPWGAILSYVEAHCSNMPCPPYDAEKELTCVVCTQ